MPKDHSIQSILVIGSGPIVIGQAAEFDYSGTQGCRALREEGYKVILVNNNPATIMTDEVNADVVYFEPLTVESIEKIIAKERPDGLLATLGGQTGLNLAFSLNEHGILDKYNVKVLGTSIDSIKKGEDREAFRSLMNELNEPVPDSEIVTTVEEAISFVEKVGFPVIIRPAYTLGGTGGGIAHDQQQLIQLSKNGLSESPITQCLIEKSIAGYKEIEYEVMRDQNGTCITICNMENIDPVGIHTGDSIVVAPSQTLTDDEFKMLQTSSAKIITALGIVGGCNIQFALDPYSKNYYLIEVNPRVSRSSALASKATGYPIAKITAKLAVGYTLDELINPITGNSFASVEPALDYVVVKFPRFPFDKFMDVPNVLGTQMKATGEVMSLDVNLEGAIQKAVHSLEGENESLRLPKLGGLSAAELNHLVETGSENRFFAVLELFRRGTTVEEIHKISKIDAFFLYIFKNLVEYEDQISRTSVHEFSSEFMQEIKEKGFTDQYIAYLSGEDENTIRAKRKEFGILPSYKSVDTCAGKFASKSSYYYSSYFGENETQGSSKQKVLILGSGPIRIGQGIEFDYSSVHGIFALQDEGYETILLNNNPETVSTDYEIADKLFFEPLTYEHVLNVIEAEKVDQVIVQFGGQTAINLAQRLEAAGVSIVGITHDVIDQLEDRDRFYKLLEKVNIKHIPGEIADDSQELLEKSSEIGYPVLIRPSYVIGGQGMVVINDEDELESFVIETSNESFPLLIDAYVPGLEIEVDLLADGNEILIPTIVEHIEKAGVHSGDSHAIIPAVSLSEENKKIVADYAGKIVRELQFKGIMNIQFVVNDNQIYVLEVNPRASRTVPVISKITGIPMAQLASKLVLGKSLQEVSSQVGLLPELPYYTVKYPVFSTYKLLGDPTVGPEMKSTGEGISIADTIDEALTKVFHSYILSKKDADEIVFDTDLIPAEIVQIAEKIGLNVYAANDISEWVKSEKALAFVSLNKDENSKKNKIKASQQRIHVFTEIETLQAFLKGFQDSRFTVMSIQERRGIFKNEKEVIIK
ncbi:carbamoyl phosphate synthase large subunit [Fredinandcohnia sp. QZ13]|uniref:carbamoyl phosphate synthase large subunit n=1 Tax=Fredinandcohnia sp. QZ13 TaxID=3073144 RepID=UPI00285362C2|nr:carbamoyl phosphate synthase large subunit [Fredinandcohnia sp. QZ13]MDR4887040.1 carbamoyl phosphate synthase large subunit [Fredinandcohnia sp. QZ13]